MTGADFEWPSEGICFEDRLVPVPRNLLMALALAFAARSASAAARGECTAVDDFMAGRDISDLLSVPEDEGFLATVPARVFALGMLYLETQCLYPERNPLPGLQSDPNGLSDTHPEMLSGESPPGSGPDQLRRH